MLKVLVFLPVVGAAATGSTPTEAAADLPRARVVAAKLARLLEDSDMLAATVWGESSGLLAPLLGSRRDAFRDAMLAYDFDAALQLLRAAADAVS